MKDLTTIHNKVKEHKDRMIEQIELDYLLEEKGYKLKEENNAN